MTEVSVKPAGPARYPPRRGMDRDGAPACMGGGPICRRPKAPNGMRTRPKRGSAARLKAVWSGGRNGRRGSARMQAGNTGAAEAPAHRQTVRGKPRAAEPACGVKSRAGRKYRAPSAGADQAARAHAQVRARALSARAGDGSCGGA